MNVLLTFFLVVGANSLGLAQSQSTNTHHVPEIPITILDSNERMRRILNPEGPEEYTPADPDVYIPERKRTVPEKNAPPTKKEKPEPAPKSKPAEEKAPKESKATNNTSEAESELEDVADEGDLDRKYFLREGDTIELKVYQEDELNTRVRLGKQGEVTLALLGTIALGGKTVEEARQEVQTLLGKDYLVNPQVVMSVVEYAKRRFSVMGQVQQPGFYNIAENEKLNLLQAISMAGGFTRMANPRSVTIKRVSNGTNVLLQVNAQEMSKGKGAKLLEIQSEDTIIVSQRVF